MNRFMAKILFGKILCYSTAGLLLTVMPACRSSRLSSPSRSSQSGQAYGDEAVLQAAVRRILESSRLASRESGVIGQYAVMLRYWYQAASGNGQQVDAGVRMLQYLQQLHFRYGGSKSLWKNAVQQAKQPGAGPDGVLMGPIPAGFK